MYLSIIWPCQAWVWWSVPLSVKYRSAVSSDSIQFGQEALVGRKSSHVVLCRPAGDLGVLVRGEVIEDQVEAARRASGRRAA